MYIDHSVYSDPDEAPTELKTPEDRAEYVHRVCGAWDFHIHPDPETFELFSGWKDDHSPHFHRGGKCILARPAMRAAVRGQWRRRTIIPNFAS
jgi:hypothetical protein